MTLVTPFIFIPPGRQHTPRTRRPKISTLALHPQGQKWRARPFQFADQILHSIADVISTLYNRSHEAYSPEL
jgi:hypothetical protein